MRNFILLLISLTLISAVAQAKIQNGMEADLVMGQPDLFTGGPNTGGISARTLNDPERIASDGTRIYVSERVNNRITVWFQPPKENFAPADIILGQTTFTGSTANQGLGAPTASTVSNPTGIATDGMRFFLTDQGNHRVLIWNQLPQTNSAPANVVLGQPGFTTAAANNGGLSASSLSSPRDIHFDGQRLFVADLTNNRILIWNQLPASNFTPADIVLGQPDFVSGTANNGGRSAKSLSAPIGVFSDGKKLYVADRNNVRFLIWNKIPTQSFTPADVVLGQKDFSTAINNDGGISASSARGVLDIYTDGQLLFTAEDDNSRILIRKAIPTTSSGPADFVLGQPNFHQNPRAVGPAQMNDVTDMIYDGRRIYAVDQDNDRILIFDVSTSSFDDLGPQFSQGKAMVGKVFWDFDGDGRQGA